MKKFTRAGKKALSVFLAALMVMTAWVFVAPEAQAQNAGSYYVKIVYNVADTQGWRTTDVNDYTGKSSTGKNNSGFSIFYKTNNGTGTDGEVYWSIGKNKITSGQASGSGAKVTNPTCHLGNEGDGVATAIIPGFPTSLYATIDHSAFAGTDSTIYYITDILVGSSEGNAKSIWKGSIYLNSNVHEYHGTLDSNYNWESGGSSSDHTKCATCETKTKNWVYPYPNTVTWDPATLSAMTCPKGSETTTQTVKVTAKDQYGVNMYDPMWSVKGSSCGTTGISMSTQNNRKESSKIQLTNAANIDGTTDSQIGTVTATWGSGQTKSKTFTINDTTYTATFTGLKNNDGTDKENVTADYKHGHIPTDAETASEYDAGDYHWTFSGWYPSTGAITTDTTYTAQYSDKFVPADLTELNSQISRANNVKNTDLWKTSSYTPESMAALESALTAANTTKNNNPGRTSQAVVDATTKNLKDAIDALKLKSYTVKFYNAEGLIIKTQEVVAGQAATAPASPAKDDDETYHYSFEAWDEAFNDVTSNLDVRPKYTQEAHIWQTSTTVPANCQHGAGIKKTCSVCSRVSQSYDDTLGAHTKSTHYAVSKEATCTTDGTGYYYCTVCGTNMGNVTIKAKGHAYDKGTVTKAATCTATGTRVHKCNSCGDTYTETLEKIPHTYSKTSTVAATCKHSAYDVMKCSCGDTYNKYVGGIAEHELTWTVKNATSASSGSVTGKCKNCDYTFTKEVPFDGHNYDFDNPTVKAATCNADGSVVIGCKDTGCTEKITIKLNKTGVHNYTTKYNAPSCTKAGSIVNTCSVCKTSTTVETIAALGHNYGEAVVTAATCTKDGKMVYTCARCNDVKTTTIPATGHKEYVIDAIEATCNTKGRTEGKKCAVCGEVILASTETAKKAHSFTGEVKKINATCEADGAKLTKCANCDAWKIETIAKTGHAYKDEVVASTCTSKGYTKHTCQNCGKVYTDNETAMIEHNYVLNADLSLAPSCEGQGVNIYVCSVCKSSKSEKVDAKGHSFGEWSEYIPATCTSKGVEIKACSVCGKTEMKDIKALGHAYATDFTTDITATCKSAGVKSKHCSRCDARTDVTVIPALAHTWGEPVVTAATCTADGVKTYTCTTCPDGTTKATKEEVIPKLGHNFVAGEPVAATCKSSGYTPYTCANKCGESYKVINGEADNTAHNWKVTTSKNGTTLTVKWLCENCGATGNETIDVAEGHNYVDATVTKQPTCTTKGTVTIACDKKHDASCTSVVTATLPVNPDAHSKIKTTVTNPTCTENGKVTTVCEACNEAVYAEQTIPAKGHSYTTQTEYVASTCNKKGYVIFKCANCTDTHNAELELNPDAHKFTKKANGHHDATCTTPAYDEYVCEHGCGETYNKYDGSSTVKAHVWKFTTSKTGTTLTVTCKCENCDASHTQTIDVAEGHNYVDATVTKQPTCKETGTVTIACDKKHDANCTSVVTATLPVNSNAHDKLKTTVTPATCEANGTATTVCESCGNTIGESVTIAELGHNYVGGKETVKTATCETDGVKTVQCTRSGCSHTTEVTIPKTGHSWDGGTLHPADCTHGAYTTYKCSNCNKTYDAVAADAKALGHDWNDWVIINPTNDKAGSVTHTCNRCSEIETVEIPAQGHTFDATKYTETPATCTKKGSRTYKCTAHENCGVSVTVDTDLAQHSYELKYSEKATCTKDGKVVMECSVCGNSKTIDIPKFGHTWNEGEVTKAATCTEEGVKTFTCSTCGETRTEKIAKLQHDFVPGEEVLPTCKDGGKSGYIPYTCSGCDESYVKLTDKNAEHKWGSFATVQEANESRCGIEKRTCSECGAVDYKFTDATGEHTYKDEVTKAATCTEEGSLTRHCTNPNHTGEKDQVLPIAALGHDMKAGKPVDATCEHEGYTDYACLRDNCDFTYRIVTAPEAGHTASGWTVVVPATCTTEGVEKQTCTVCEEILNERTIKATDHSTKTVTKDATCLEPSMSYTYCTTCNMLIGEVTVRNALGHNFVEDAEQYVAPTNSKNGKKVLECSRCGETITVTIPAEGHKFELVSKVDATCNKTGLETYKCKTHTGENDCGLSYTNVIPKKEHTYATKVETEATCTTGGEGAYYCLYCNKIFGRYYIAPFGHDLIKDEAGSKDATCNSVGYDTYKCSRDCGETKVVYRSTLGSHKWGDWELIQAADETHPEIKVRKCSVCNLYEYRTEPPTGEHDYDEGVVTKAPTCTEPGVKTFTCRRTHCACTPGNEKTYTVKIAPTGHKAKIDKKDATCAEAGYIKVVCTVCKNEIGERITLEQKKHIYQSKVTSEPTCSKEGVRTYTCALCGDSYTETIATISHDYQQTERRVAPTCTTDGFDVYECKYCGKESFVKTAEKLGHTEKTITIAATCTTKGSKTVVCSVCNTILKETEYTSALGHKWGEWKATVPGTCAVEGQKTRECSRCHDTETVSTGTGEHVYPAEGVVTPATCTADGFTTYTCTVCKKHSVIKDYTPKLGHKYSADYKIIVQPTCHSTGAKAHYCVRCGAFEAEHDHSYVPLPRLAHTYGEWVVETEPTCDTNGVKKRTCTGCTDKDEGHTQTELIGKIGHNYGEWEVTKKATCVEEGSQRRYCDRCKTWEVQATPKGGHNRVADYAVEATCTAPGKTAGSHCSICGYVFVAQQEVPMKEHMDLNGDGRCEGCGKTMYSPSGKTDSCLCHGTGFRALIYKFVLIIWKIFKINKNCVCGAEHY